MKANKKSIHAALYKFTYSGKLPENLCQYIWELFFAVIIFIPNFVFQFPSRIENEFENENRNCGDHRVMGICLYGFLFIALPLYCIMSYNWIKAMFYCYDYNYYSANAGWITNLIILISIIHWIINKPNKNCPKIDWEEEKIKEIPLNPEIKTQPKSITEIQEQKDLSAFKFTYWLNVHTSKLPAFMAYYNRDQNYKDGKWHYIPRIINIEYRAEHENKKICIELFCIDDKKMLNELTRIIRLYYPKKKIEWTKR
jgi:hypothetical protein